MITFSPVSSVFAPIVKLFDDGPEITTYSFTLLVTVSDIKIFAEYSTLFAVKYNLSFTFAPILYPWVRIGGTSSWAVYP